MTTHPLDPLLELSPCPGCGGNDTRVIGGPNTRGGPKYWAGCDYCHWRTWGDTEVDAIAEWNKREPDPVYWQNQHAAALRVIDELRAANAREGGVDELVEAVRMAREWHRADKWRNGDEHQRHMWECQLAHYNLILAKYPDAPPTPVFEAQS